MKKKVIVFGNTKMAEMVFHYFNYDSNYKIEAFCVGKDYIKEDSFMGLPLVPFENIQEIYPPSEYGLFIAIGYEKLSSARKKFCKEGEKKGYQLVSYISSHVISPCIDTLKYGKNCFIFENQVFQPNVTIGDNVIIWSGNHFGHDVKIGDNTFITSQTVFSGASQIGNHCFIGINCSIRDQVKIGDNCIIGAGALITRDIPEDSVFIEKNTAKYPLSSEQFEKMMNISK